MFEHVVACIEKCMMFVPYFTQSGEVHYISMVSLFLQYVKVVTQMPCNFAC